MPTPTLSEIHIVVELPPKPMVTLFCSLVGVRGSAFPVEIESQASVAALATAIAKAKPNAIECDPDELQLYLAKRGSAWLKDGDKAAVDLKKGSMSGSIQAMVSEDKEMASTWSVQESLDAEHLPSPGRRAIHVLVVAPAPTKSLKRKREDDEEEGGGVKKAKSGHKSEEEKKEEGEPWLCFNEMRVYTKHPCLCEQYREATGRY
ncbi:hypothetical protein BBJ28_00006373 [Nothophytophthora sp. Chile5]|nr:hypothetical protein BBJ28_00006373 [Nothophytophthora sp. Chile5]